MSAPIAPKAQAGGVAAAVSGAVLYLLQQYVFKGDVPDGVASMIYIAVPGVLAFAAAWLAPHQVRSDDQPSIILPPQVTAAQDEKIRQILAADSGRMEPPTG